MVLGHADYYPRFGFESADALGITAPFKVPTEAWMAYRLPHYTPNARGELVYPEAFASVA
jgi:predicted N-acetyltransferase YhbS